MPVTVEIPPYDPNHGFTYRWEDGFTIHTSVVDGTLMIQVNKAGLISLANHLLNLAQAAVPPGTHLHLDEHNSLEQASTELIIAKV